MRTLIVTLAAAVGCGGTHATHATPVEHEAPAAARCDTSTPAARQALYTKVTGLPFVPQEGHFYDQTCLEGSKTFPGLLTTGTFATEIGCQWTHSDEEDDKTSPLAWVGAIYDCAFLPSSATVAPTAMARAGWATADLAHRTKLVWAWIDEVEHVQLMEAAPEPGHWPADKTFTTPTAVAASGGVTVSFWVANNTMGRGDSYTKQSIAFTAAGQPGAATAIDDASTPGD